MPRNVRKPGSMNAGSPVRRHNSSTSSPSSPAQRARQPANSPASMTSSDRKIPNRNAANSFAARWCSGSSEKSDRCSDRPAVTANATSASKCSSAGPAPSRLHNRGIGEAIDLSHRFLSASRIFASRLAIRLMAAVSFSRGTGSHVWTGFRSERWIREQVASGEGRADFAEFRGRVDHRLDLRGDDTERGLHLQAARHILG